MCARFKSNGQLDASFASGGVLAIPGTRLLDLVRVAADRRIYVTGLTNDDDAVIYRIWP